MRKTINHATQYTDNIRINTADELVNAIMFFNTGSDTFTVNTVPVLAGASLSFTCNQDEIDISTYDVVFLTTSAPQMLVIKKVYSI